MKYENVIIIFDIGVDFKYFYYISTNYTLMIYDYMVNVMCYVLIVNVYIIVLYTSKRNSLFVFKNCNVSTS